LPLGTLASLGLAALVCLVFLRHLPANPTTTAHHAPGLDRSGNVRAAGENTAWTPHASMAASSSVDATPPADTIYLVDSPEQANVVQASLDAGRALLEALYLAGHMLWLPEEWVLVAGTSAELARAAEIISVDHYNRFMAGQTERRVVDLRSTSASGRAPMDGTTSVVPFIPASFPDQERPRADTGPE
jgi:hypothetical protein